MPLDPTVPPVAYFQRRTGGTAGNIGGPVYLGYDEDGTSGCIAGTNYAPAEVKIVPEGQLITAVVETYYFGLAAGGETEHTVRKRVRDYIEAARVALGFREPLVKQMARATTVMPVVFESFGDLKLLNDGTTVLDACTLRSAEITDDVALNAVGVRFVFVRVSATSNPA